MRWSKKKESKETVIQNKKKNDVLENAEALYNGLNRTEYSHECI